MNRYRRNPKITLDTLIEAAEKFGYDDFVWLLRNGPREVIDELVDEFNKAVEKTGETGPLTDKQAWKRLAEIAKDVGKAKGWPAELIRALQDVFMEKSAAA